MIKAGLTGSIGMGKSTTANMFREAGIPVYDADAIVHQLYEGAAAPLIEKEFPGTTTNGKVDRQLLGNQVLGNSKAIKKLETIVHPMVQAKQREFIEQAKKTGAKLVVLDIPLLFEAGGINRVDKVIVVTAPAEVQRKRVLARPGMTVEKFEAILEKQLPDTEKRARADFIIDTSLGMEAAKTAVKNIIAELT